MILCGTNSGCSFLNLTDRMDFTSSSGTHSTVLSNTCILVFAPRALIHKSTLLQTHIHIPQVKDGPFEEFEDNSRLLLFDTTLSCYWESLDAFNSGCTLCHSISQACRHDDDDDDDDDACEDILEYGCKSLRMGRESMRGEVTHTVLELRSLCVYLERDS